MRYRGLLFKLGLLKNDRKERPEFDIEMVSTYNFFGLLKVSYILD